MRSDEQVEHCQERNIGAVYWSSTRVVRGCQILLSHFEKKEVWKILLEELKQCEIEKVRRRKLLSDEFSSIR